MTNSRRFAILLFFSSAAAFSQSTTVLVNAGYAEPAPFEVAPGQILTFFYRGIGPAAGGEPRSGKATAPLPTLLAGLSAQIIQENQLVNVPLLEVRQQNACETGLSGVACVLTAVKLQIPYEVAGDVQRDGQAGPVAYSPAARLVLYADGVATASSAIQPLPDNAHVLTTCDNTWDTRPSVACERQAFHLDGSPVSSAAPAARGETISILAYGLGQTAPRAVTGAFAQPGFFLTDVLGSPRVKMTFRSFVNALPSTSRHAYSPSEGEIPATIAGAGLQAGQVGVYQFNLEVPSSVSPAIPCNDAVRSNYVLNVITSQGVETIPVCVN